MNSLSILIYVASIVHSFSGLLFAAGLGLLVFTLAKFIMCCHNNDMAYEGRRGYEKVEHSYGVPVSLSVLVFTLSALVPSKETIYLIAGSEAGEYVVDTPEAQEILTDIHTIIQQQLKEAIND